MVTLSTLVCCLALLPGPLAGGVHAPIHWKSYDGYHVLGVATTSRAAMKVVQDLQRHDQVALLSGVMSPGADTKVMVGPDSVGTVKDALKAEGLRWHILDGDLQASMKAEEDRLNARFANRNRKAFDINDFNTYSDIMAHTDLLAEQCNVAQGVGCLTYDAGFSFEGRNQKVLRMTKEGATGPRSEVFVDSTIHGNEWLATATMMKVMDRMVNQYPEDPDVARLVDQYDWYFLPVENPDGYSYTWTDDRSWRKSRNVNPGSSCPGTDLNRNFAFNWNMGGSSDDPCSNTYSGAGPLSEPESSNIDTEAGSHRQGALVAWVSLHTAGNVWVYPYGTSTNGTCDTDPVYNEDLQRAGEAAAVASSAVNATSWQAGTICDVMYVAAGTETDHMLGAQGIPYSYTVELRSMPTPDSKEDIEPSFQEAWAGLVALMKAIE